MSLKALLITLVIALGLTLPAEARTKHPKQPKQSSLQGSSKVRQRKPAKIKPMKFRGTKHAPKAQKTQKRPKAPKMKYQKHSKSA